MYGFTSFLISSLRWSMLAPGKLSIWRFSSLNDGILERFESPKINWGFLILMCQSLAFLLLLICLIGSCTGVCLNELPFRLSLLTRPPGWSDGDGGCSPGDDIGAGVPVCWPTCCPLRGHDRSGQSHVVPENRVCVCVCVCVKERVCV